MICEASEEKKDGDDMEGEETAKKGHGRCGHVQPLIRKEGLKLFLVYKRTKDDEDMVCSFYLKCEVTLTFFTGRKESLI